jgi:hypothetical protein
MSSACSAVVPQSIDPQTSFVQGQVIPGLVQAEFFDQGGEGKAYHDTKTVNQGNGKLNLGAPDGIINLNPV